MASQFLHHFYMLQGLPDVGPALANRLLLQFDSIDNNVAMIAGTGTIFGPLLAAKKIPMVAT